MLGVVNKFVITSMCMFAAPIAILYGFHHSLLPDCILSSIFSQHTRVDMYSPSSALAATSRSTSAEATASIESLIPNLDLFSKSRRSLSVVPSDKSDGSSDLSSESMTLWSGILAVISVKVIIAFYIYMAMKEPSGKLEPDPKFAAEAKASFKQSRPSEESNRSKHE